MRVVPRSVLGRMLPVGLLAISAACTSVSAQRDHDRDAALGLVRERLGVEVPAHAGDGDGIADEVIELLREPLTEASAVRIALLNNRMVRAELAELGVASADLVQAGVLSNPVLAADAKFFDGGTEIEFGLVQSLLDVFFLNARKRIHASELEATKARVARKIIRLACDVRRALIEVRAARRLVDVEREIVRAAQASADLMAELHRAGNVTDPPRTADELALIRAQLALAQAEAAEAEAVEPLNVLLGLWGDHLVQSVSGGLTEDAGAGLDLAQLEARAVTASLDLVELRARATAEARRAGIDGWEAVLGHAEVGVAGMREADGSEWGLGPALGFGLPVFDRGTARRAASAARLEQLHSQHVARAVEVRSAARRLRERFSALHERAAIIRDEQLPKASRLVRETLRNYNAMQIGVFDVFVVRQQEIEAARDHVETLRDAWLARVDIEELHAGSLNEERIAARPAASGHAAQPMESGGH